MIISTYILRSRKNPVKAGIIILWLRTLIFLLTNLAGGSAWFRSLTFLIFTGGILIMFIVLSRFHPNETPQKINYKNITIIILGASLLPSSIRGIIDVSLERSRKIIYQRRRTAFIITMLVILYFSIFLKILGSKKNSMRITIC